MRQNTAVVVFSRTPELARRNADEPYAALPWDDLDALFTALLGDVLENLVQLPDADILLFHDERKFPAEFLAAFKERVHPRELAPGPFAAAAHAAIEAAFAEHYHRVVALFDNNPLGLPGRFRRMLDQLGQEDDSVVLEPTIDGRVAALAMKANHAWVLDPRDGDPLARPHLALQRLCALPTIVIPTPPSYLLDSGSNLSRLRAELAPVLAHDAAFPRRAEEVFRAFDRKYRPRKGGR